MSSRLVPSRAYAQFLANLCNDCVVTVYLQPFTAKQAGTGDSGHFAGDVVQLSSDQLVNWMLKHRHATGSRPCQYSQLDFVPWYPAQQRRLIIIAILGMCNTTAFVFGRRPFPLELVTISRSHDR